MKKLLTAVGTIIFFVIFVYILYIITPANPNAGGDYTITPNGTIYKVNIDGHQYLKSGNSLTHSESCPCKK